MKLGFVCRSRFVSLVLLILLPVAMHGRSIAKIHPHHGHHHQPHYNGKDSHVVKSPELYGRVVNKNKPPVNVMHKTRADPLQVAGSSLPDCTHACGSCTPCRLVMVSFVCSSIEEAETCPMAYKCMCHNKSYPVP